MSRLPNIPVAVVNLLGVGVRRTQRHWRTIVRVLQQLGRKAQRQGELLSHAPTHVRAHVQRGQAAVVRSRKRLERFDEHVLGPYRTERRVEHLLAQASGNRRPVIVGPWTSEVGYETLYWVPFLRWAIDRYAVESTRVIAISRGGVGGWYGGIADRYVEIFDLVEAGEFARQAAARRDSGDQKQITPSAFDRELIRLAMERLGIRDAVVWHPGLMYQLLRAFWHGDRSLDFLFRHTDYRGTGPIATVAAGPPLPGRYAAAKFYAGPALPDTETNRHIVGDLVQRLATRMPVVMLDTAWSVDEHHDYAFDGTPGVTTLRPSLDPRTNLGVQTQVIAGASLFVGTCGGLAWLAPRLGVETLAVYEDDRYLTAHLYAARYVFRRMQAAPFSTLNIRALRGLRAA